MRTLAVILALALPSSALSAPGFIPIQGTLADSSGVAIDGQVDVTFTLYSDSTGATSLWTDTVTVDVVSGGFATELGTVTALDLDTFGNYAGVHLGIQVSGDTEMPLVPLDHVPYAAWAERTGSADSLDGLSLNDIRAEIPTPTDIEDAARGVAYDTEAELTTLLDDNYTYTGSTGIDISGNAISVVQSTIEGFATGVCYDTEAELTAVLDDNYTYTAGTGVGISGNVISIDQATVEGWANGVDDDTTYAAGTGLSLSGTTFHVDQTTVEGWANGVDDDTTYTAGTGLNLSGTTFSADQSTVEGWATGVAYNTSAEVVAALDGQEINTGCPTGMAKVANTCIHTTPYARGLDWWTAMDTCLADGFRMCSQTEVVNGLRAGVVDQFDFNVQDTWYTTASQAENTPGQTGENQICEVQGNTNQPDHPAYTVQCQHEKAWTSSWRATICCY